MVNLLKLVATAIVVKLVSDAVGRIVRDVMDGLVQSGKANDKEKCDV